MANSEAKKHMYFRSFSDVDICCCFSPLHVFNFPIFHMLGSEVSKFDAIVTKNTNIDIYIYISDTNLRIFCYDRIEFGHLRPQHMKDWEIENM
jgi:hypothetical protein